MATFNLCCKPLLCLVLCCTSSYSFTQTLPDERRADWSSVGSNEEAGNWPVVNILDYGGINDGTQSNNDAFNNIISLMDGEPGILFFPSGEYFFDRPLDLPDYFILRGESAKETIFYFDLVTSDYAIKIIGEDTPLESSVEEPIQVTADKLDAANTNLFQPGDYLYIYDTDTAKVESNWAKYTTGQINQAINISNSIIRFKSSFRRAYKSEDEPKVRKIKPRQMVGIENLKIVRLDLPVEKNSNIFFHYAVNCWVNCIESYYCDFAHLEIARSSNIQVKGSYFQHGFSYGGGGKAYGIVLHYGAGECLIENNTFEHLRHALLLQAGANGNVVSYNYSTSPYWDQTGFPSNAAGDLVLHGNYPYANLFEGNIVQNIIIDDSHGIQGPHNTFFRNRSEGYGLIMASDPSSSYQNIIGNEITGSIGLFITPGENHFLYGNNIRGEIEPPGTETLPDSSYYLETVPAYFQVPDAWPAIGPSNEIGTVINEAYARFQAEAFVACTDAIYAPPVHPVFTTLEEKINSSEIILFPNPSSDVLYVELNSHTNIHSWSIVGLDGKSHLTSHSIQNQIWLNGLSNGLYLFQLTLVDGQRISQRFIVQK